MVWGFCEVTNWEVAKFQKKGQIQIESKDRGLCAAEISGGTIQGFRVTGSYEKLQVKKEGQSCAVFPSIGAVVCRIRVEPEPTADLQIG